MGLTWIAVGLLATVFLHFMMGSPAVDEALDARGQTVMATPVDYRTGSSSQNGAVQRYVIELRFEDANGEMQTASLETNHQDQHDAAEAGRPMEIEYDPEDPSTVRWPGSKLNPLGNLIYWIGGSISVLGLGVAIGGLALRRTSR